MSSLGAQLKNNIQAQAEADARAAAAKQAEHDAAHRAMHAKVEGFLTQARSNIAGSILAGAIPKPIRISHSTEFDSYNWPRKPNLTFEDVMPDYRGLTMEFDGWMAENGLAYTLEFDHDGVGMESWHNLTVKAR